MKKCQFCAEDIQDAAIVCKHCQRDLPKPAPAVTPAALPKPSSGVTNAQIGVLLVVVAVIVVAFMVDKVRHPERANHHSSDGSCVLQARAALVTKDAPIMRATKTTTDLLALRSFDNADWSTVQIIARGMLTTSSGTVTTGPYLATVPGGVEAGKLTSVQMDSFESPKGRWASLTMTPDEVEISAIMRGEQCSATVNVASTNDR